MKLKADLINEDSLAALGAEAARLLLSGSFESLADRFGYATALGREPAQAIQEDLNRSLVEVNAEGLDPSSSPTLPVIRFLGPNNSGLYGVIECLLRSTNGSEILLEMVITAKGDEKHLTLEQICAAA